MIQREVEMDISQSISLSVSKDGPAEEMSISLASLKEAAERRESAISNENIRSGDRILDTYTVRDEAIRGGMGSVWRVHHEGWDIDLAMKRPQPRFFAEGSRRRKEEFIKECENWINLGLHPNIVSCYYVREIGGVPTVFSEWMDGGSLRDRIEDGLLYKGSQEEVKGRILDIAIQVVRGLRYSHEKHLVHQDVKPGNMLLTKTWEAKVADFGLAKARENLKSFDPVDQVLTTGYTLAYCPEEQVMGGEAQEWMDVYAFTLTVLEMYAGERFWERGAEAFMLLFDEGCGDSEIKWRIDPPEKLMQALWNDSHSGGSWQSCADMEVLLTEIYEEETGGAYFRDAFNEVSHTADSLNNMALSYLDLGRRDEAVRLWEQAKELELGHPDTTYNFALYKWMSGEETDLYLLDEIDRVTDDERRTELHRKAAVVRGEITADMAPEDYVPPVNREDWTYRNSSELGDSYAIYGRGTVRDWILSREGLTEEKPSTLFSISDDGESICREGKFGYQYLIYGRPAPSADGSAVVFRFLNDIRVYSVSDCDVVYRKKFPKDTILSYCGSSSVDSCYLGRKDGLYEYYFEKDEMRLILSSDSGIYDIKMRRGGELLILCDGQNTLMVMNRLRGEITVTIPTLLPPGRRFDNMSAYPAEFDTADGDTILFYSMGNRLFRYALDTGELLSEEMAGDEEEDSRVWDVQGHFRITGHYNNCQIWDAESKLCLRSFRAHAIHQSCFLSRNTRPGEFPEEGGLSGFFLSGFPSRYRHFRIPGSRLEPVWSLCRIRSTAEQTQQDTEFVEHISKSRHALEEGEFTKAYEELSAARELPNRKNDPECLSLYDCLYPHMKRGNPTDCTVIYDFGPKAFPNFAPPLAPDGSWLYKSEWRGEGEILSTTDGHCIRRFPVSADEKLSCGNTRLTCIVRGGRRKKWNAEVYSLPDGEKLLSQEFISGGEPKLESIWTEEERTVIAVTVPSLISGKTILYIDPEKGVLTDKAHSRPYQDPVITAARKNGMPWLYGSQLLSNGVTAFIYDADDKKLGTHKRIDFYGKSCKLIGRYDFKNRNRAYSDDIVRPALLPGGYLAGECSHSLMLYLTSNFAGPGDPRYGGMPLPLAAPFHDTSMSEDCRYLFNGGRVCRIDWELL